MILSEVFFKECSKCLPRAMMMLPSWFRWANLQLYTIWILISLPKPPDFDGGKGLELTLCHLPGQQTPTPAPHRSLWLCPPLQICMISIYELRFLAGMRCNIISMSYRDCWLMKRISKFAGYNSEKQSSFHILFIVWGGKLHSLRSCCKIIWKNDLLCKALCEMYSQIFPFKATVLLF